jgi:hypothetical protein
MTMKKVIFALFIFALVTGCKDKTSAPDVSHIQVPLEVKRFDQDFFSIDTLGALAQQIGMLQNKYPGFLPIYLENIVGVADIEGIRAFYRLYKPIYDSSRKIYQDFGTIRDELHQAFRYVNYYFPSYKLPKVIMPVIGPMNSREDLARMANGEYTPNFIGPDFLGISLQFYLGEQFSLYHTEYFVNTIAPLYRSRRFSKEYIAADAMKLVTDDIFPDKSSAKPLIDQMIEKGKQWWLLDRFLPETPDSIKTGYTQTQLNWCEQNEGLIWSYIVKNEDLRSVSPATLQTYLGEAPFTSVFSQEESPGNIGPWIGRQIIRKYEDRNAGIKPEDLMNTPPSDILEGAKYKPK